MSFNKIQMTEHNNIDTILQLGRQNVDFAENTTVRETHFFDNRVRQFFYHLLGKTEQTTSRLSSEKPEQNTGLLALENCAEAARKTEASGEYEWSCSDENKHA